MIEYFAEQDIGEFAQISLPVAIDEQRGVLLEADSAM